MRRVGEGLGTRSGGRRRGVVVGTVLLAALALLMAVGWTLLLFSALRRVSVAPTAVQLFTGLWPALLAGGLALAALAVLARGGRTLALLCGAAAVLALPLVYGLVIR